MKLYTRIMISVILAVVLAGCSGSVGDKVAEKALETALSEDGQKVQVDLDSKGENISIAIQGDESTMDIATGDALTPPEGFPKDIPLYTNMTLQLVQSIEESNTYILNGQSADPLPKVDAFYKEQLTKHGWKQEMNIAAMGDTRMYNVEKEKRTLNVVLAADSGITNIQLTTSSHFLE